MRPLFPLCLNHYALISIHASLTGCDYHICVTIVFKRISIHASLTGCDINRATTCILQAYFNPRIPHGMRPPRQAIPCIIISISIHASLTGCDVFDLRVCTATNEFQSTHPSRDATRATNYSTPISLFQSTHPSRDATVSSSPIPASV